MANSASPPNGSQPNFLNLRQMDWNRKRMHRTSEICMGVKLGSKNVTFGWTVPHYIKHGVQTREGFKKATRSYSGSSCLPVLSDAFSVQQAMSILVFRTCYFYEIRKNFHDV